MPYKVQKLSASRSSAKHIMPHSSNKVAERPARQQSYPTPVVRQAQRNPEPLTAPAMLQLQRAIGNRGVGQLALKTASPDVIRRTRWVWDGRQWIADGPRNTPYPRFAGSAVGAVYREEPVGPDPYAQVERLANGTTIDYPALIRVMDNVTLGVEVTPDVWRQMRQDLSMAITLQNKSHPAHGSNFNKNQRPEQQIIDWANVIAGELKEKLAKFFREKYDIYL